MSANKIIILGLGREGLATLALWEKWSKNGNWPVQLSDFGWSESSQIIVADQNELGVMTNETRHFLGGLVGVKMFLGKNYLEQMYTEGLGQKDLIIKTPGINKRIEGLAKILESGVKLGSATNIFYLLKKGEVIAVTGSKGKSTTATLIYEILKAGGLKVELIGNIGKPALEFLADDSAEKVYVFEMSSYQLEDFQGVVDQAVLVSFFPDHLDYHGGLTPYFKAKMKLVEAVKAGGEVFYNGGSPEIVEYLENIIGFNKIAFNDGKSSLVKGVGLGAAAWFNQDLVVGLREINLLGRHNLQNMLAAVAVGLNFGVEIGTIRKVLTEFKGLEHRLEKVGVKNEVTYFNDAISTTPESSIAAILAISDRFQIGTMLVGGLDRGYVFGEFAEAILKAGIKNLVIFPETGQKIWEEIERLLVSGSGVENNFVKPKVLMSSNMVEAVNWAAFNTNPGEVCLLSNASPSYNLFKNFEDKGLQFKEAVRNIK